MSAAHPAAVHGPAASAARSAGRLAAAAGLLLLAVAAGVVLSRHPLPLTVVLAFGFGLLGTLALALARYNTAVALGIFLLAAVRIEPAPADLILFVVIAVALVTGRFDLRRVPLIVTVLLGVFLALNMLASVELIDFGRGVMFFAITLYLVVLSLWLTSYVRSSYTARVVLRAYVAAAVVSAAVAVLALFVAFPGHSIFVTGPRAQGLFKDPNVLGPFLVPAALLLLEETVAPRLLRARLATKVALISILTVGILFSFSRAAWLNLVVGAFVMFCVLALRRGGGRRAMTFLVAARLGDRCPLRGSRGHVVFRIPERARALPGVRLAAVRGSALRRRAGHEVPAGHRTGPVRAGLADLGAQHLRPRPGRGRHARTARPPGCPAPDARLREPKRGPRQRHLRHRLGRPARRLVRGARQQRVHRHAALAAFLAPGGARSGPGRRVPGRRPRPPSSRSTRPASLGRR